MRPSLAPVAWRRSAGFEVRRAGAVGRHRVAGVAQRALLQAQTAAADAAVEPVAEQLDASDLLVEPLPPVPAQLGPVGLGGGAVLRQRRHGLTDLVQGEPDPLCGPDERDPAKGGLLVAPLVAGRA